ncbi:dihydroxyacetone kinase family protein [Propionibacterium freudenreichii]|uniref:dihydroxyacetone kinase family protein n=1 Tax=Propionibacterium freudenreichii TaxID=1744 RepID=UPI00054207E4|nr:dihydroxyacetone kinase family protein [Propionibacterium freudenreichii]CEH05924.1 Dihydroxyacetone kinase [Propionibacterium freudenreichii]
MTYLVNDPKQFAADSLTGMVAANEDYLTEVHGGVTRATDSPQGEVAVIVGGGSGHYPAFAGWVGPGMAHGAVCGNIFASPSASQVESVVRASDHGGGAVLLFGNYAGDRLQFGAAQSPLRADGIDTRIVTISDDIASDTPQNWKDRRGIAGDLFVVKAACAAAAAGRGLDAVEAAANRANEATRSMGVAFTGCTLPGADEPLFTVPEGEYALGLGIHGEPGISSHKMDTAEGIATLLVERVLAEEPARTAGGYDGHVAVLVNGLGATKYEELFVLYGTVKKLLTEHGLTIVHPIVGEQVTSLDMAGVSLSLMYLDPDLEELWLAPGDSPAYKTGSVTAGQRREVVAHDEKVAIRAGSPESAAQAEELLPLLQALAEMSSANEASLGKLDSIAGDGDHGQGMVLGSSAALKAAKQAVAAHAGTSTLFDVAGAAWSEGAGGTSGALWGAALRELGAMLSDNQAATDDRLGRAAIAAARRFAQLGEARPGDKTMVDATAPFADELAARLDAGDDLATAWAAAAKAATKGAESTADMVARKGRARTHGTASLGHQDPGAVSFALLMSGLADRLANS